jgi:hypothetical protein
MFEDTQEAPFGISEVEMEVVKLTYVVCSFSFSFSSSEDGGGALATAGAETGRGRGEAVVCQSQVT